MIKTLRNKNFIYIIFFILLVTRLVSMHFWLQEVHRQQEWLDIGFIVYPDEASIPAPELQILGLPISMYSEFLYILIPYVIMFAVLVFSKRIFVYLFSGLCFIINGLMAYVIFFQPEKIEFSLTFIFRDSLIIEFFVALFLIDLIRFNKKPAHQIKNHFKKKYENNLKKLN